MYIFLNVIRLSGLASGANCGEMVSITGECRSGPDVVMPHELIVPSLSSGWHLVIRGNAIADARTGLQQHIAPAAPLRHAGGATASSRATLVIPSCHPRRQAARGPASCTAMAAALVTDAGPPGFCA
jgi:hypothetical protein